ncbi:MAG: hypothetical protein ACLFVI_08665 [Archaeoglobaceae archaeon]
MKMKWLIVLATLLLAAGSGMAQQHDGDGGKVNGAEVSNHTHADVGLNKTDNRDNSNVKQKIEQNTARKEQLREKLQERLENKLQLDQNGNNGKDKERIKEKIKEKIGEARSATDNAKRNYRAAQQMYLKTKEDNPSQAPTHARTMMKTGVNYMDSWLERIELQTLDSDLDNETKLEILNKIDQYRNTTREELEKVNNTTDMSQMREAARDLSNQWKEIRLFIKATGYQIATGELENIIEKAENLEPRLEEMRNNASNTTRFDTIIADYHRNLQLAEENAEQAQNVLANATTVQEVMEGHKLVFKATNNLKQVFKDIRLIKNEFLA